MEYSLTERSIEREHISAGLECGLGITPWSPLAAGFLAGKYERTPSGATGQGRLSGPNPFGNQKFTEKNWHLLDQLRLVAGQLNRPMAQVALAWVSARPGITAPIIGASNRDQLADNLASLTIRFTPEHLRMLDEASALDPAFPYGIFTPAVNRSIFGGTSVKGWR